MINNDPSKSIKSIERNMGVLSFLSCRYIYDTVLGIRCVGVGECQSEDPFVCFGVKPTQRACARDLPLDRKKTRKGRFQNRQEK